jgi:hypothetical protein
MTDTKELLKLIEVARETVAGGSQVRGLLARCAEKITLLHAAQSVAKAANPSLELLQQILDEDN